MSLQWLKRTNKQKVGDEKEHRAKTYLEQHGLTVVTQNYACRFGEIDIICFDQANETLVMVEVRYRNTDKYGGAAGSVTKSKQAKIKKAALFYLATRKLDTRVRFDVIAIEQQQLNWIQSAFS